jgi:tetratricopeptide (TPR) repeat protein
VDQQNYSKAAEILENALVIYKKHYGPLHNKTARVTRSLAESYLRSGNFSKAEDLLYLALNISTQAKHPDQFKCLELLSDLYIEQSKKLNDVEQKAALQKKAHECLEKSFKIAKALLPDDALHIKRIEEKLSQLAGTG